MTLSAAFSELSESFHTVICQRNEQGFSVLNQALTNSLGFDRLMGGMFNNLDAAEKQLTQNTDLSVMYTLAANVFSVPDFARTAANTLASICQNFQLRNGFYADSISYSDTAIDIQLLRSSLDDAQWRAFKTSFAIADDGVLHWHQLTQQVPVEELAVITGLHPKQVPWALDGAVNILAQMIHEPTPSATYSVRTNLSFCTCLFLSATYLNQPQHADRANQLFNRLVEHGFDQHIQLWQQLLLQRLVYEWNEEDFNNLSQLSSRSLPNPVVKGLHDLCAIEVGDSCWDGDNDRDLLAGLLTECRFVVLIEGPIYEARNWLQLSNNHFHHEIWFFARPSEESTHARAIDSHGHIQYFSSLDDLLQFTQTVTVSPANRD